MWMFTISKENLLKALEEIKAAEDNGFNYCQPTFEMIELGYGLSNCRAVYVDLIEKAHPTDGNFNWGRGQKISTNYKFSNGELIKIEKEKS